MPARNQSSGVIDYAVAGITAVVFCHTEDPAHKSCIFFLFRSNGKSAHKSQPFPGEFPPQQRGFHKLIAHLNLFHMYILTNYRMDYANEIMLQDRRNVKNKAV